MTTTYNNQVNAPYPLYSGVAAGPTAHGVIIGEGSSAVAAVTLAAGQVLVGTTASDPAAATITGSAGITVTSSTGAINIAGSGAGLTWLAAATAPTVAVNTAYVNTDASPNTFTLPTTAALGSVVGVVGQGAGTWTLAPGAGQTIKFGNQSASTGIVSTTQYDTIFVVCIVANTTWSVYSVTGNPSYS
jgi:hypothetical protein